jgi:hypothetical protein
MALRGNALAIEKEIDIKQVRTEDNAEDGGIDYGRELNNFVDGFMSHDEAQLSQAREVLVDAMGAAGMVEAAAVAGNFQRMVRIADSIGIPIDEARLELSTGLREELGLNEFHSAQNTLNRH